MPIPGTETGNASLGAAAKEVAERASALVRLELELAKVEVSRKLGSLGAGIGLGLGAAVVAVYGSAFSSPRSRLPWRSCSISGSRC